MKNSINRVKIGQVIGGLMLCRVKPRTYRWIAVKMVLKIMEKYLKKELNR